MKEGENVYGEMARHEDYLVLYCQNSDVGLVQYRCGSDGTHVVRDMALKIAAHGGLEAWLKGFVKRGGIKYDNYARGVSV